MASDLRKKFEALAELFPDLKTDDLFWKSVDQSIADGMTEAEFIACLRNESKTILQ